VNNLLTSSPKDNNMETLRPWRKSTLQVISVEHWKGLVVNNQSQPDSSESFKEEEQQQLQQVGGHGAQDKAQAMQVSGEGLVLKPIQAGERGQREAAFYKDISSSSDPSVALFYQFVPQFFGLSRKIMEDGTKAEYLMMENLTQGFKLPCIMDVKIGARTWGPDSSPEKRAAQDASYSGTKKPFGFSVPGLAVYKGAEIKAGKKPEQIVHGKDFGRALSAETIDTLLPLFLAQDVRPSTAKSLAKIFVRKLQKIQALFQVQTTFHLYGSSLLFVYDAAACSSTDEAVLEKSASVKMIDFAHVWPAEGKVDTNYLNGVDNLVSLFQKLA